MGIITFKKYYCKSARDCYNFETIRYNNYSFNDRKSILAISSCKKDLFKLKPYKNYTNIFNTTENINNVLDSASINYSIFSNENLYDRCDIADETYYQNRRKESMNKVLKKLNVFGDIGGIVNNSISDLIISFIKDEICYELYLRDRDGYNSTIKYINNKFVVKCENHINLNIHKNVIFGDNKGEVIYTDTAFIAPIDKHTYGYFAFGNKIPKYVSGSDYYDKCSDIDLYILIFGKNKDKYKKYLDKLMYKVNIIDSSNNGIYYVTTTGDKQNELEVTYSELQKRDESTVFYSSNEFKIISNHIDKFINNEKFYEEREIIYKTGILLYGEPGTGKSTIVKILSHKYGRPIIQIDVGKIEYLDLKKISDSINYSIGTKFIVLLEDIDTIYLNRKDCNDDKNNNVINKLLQFLDSNTSPNNVIFIATTNNKNKLDDALLREGRFDLKIEISNLKLKESIEFGMSFGLTEDKVKEILCSLNPENDEKYRYNQSKLQALFIKEL